MIRRKILLGTTGLIALFCAAMPSKTVNASTVKHMSNITVNDISTGRKFTSKEYRKGIMWTRQVVEFSHDEPVEITYKVGALCTDYFQCGMVKNFSETIRKSFTTNEAIATSVNITRTQSDLIKVGIGAAVSSNVAANAEASKTYGTSVSGAFTETYSHEFTEENVQTLAYDIDSIDTSKETFALGYVVECIRFKIVESYEIENRIFVGWTKKNEYREENYYGYVYTYMYKTWIYDNGKSFGVKGKIHEINQE